VIFTPALSCSVSTGLVPPNSRESNVLDSVAEGVGAGVEICVGTAGEGAEIAGKGMAPQLILGWRPEQYRPEQPMEQVALPFRPKPTST
jgi:hypothetical protein